MKLKFIALIALLSVPTLSSNLFAKTKNNMDANIKLDVFSGDKEIIQEFNSIQKALIASRQYPSNSRKSLVIGTGKYYLPETILVGAEDAGLTIEGEQGKKVVLYGGKRIVNWKKSENGRWVANLPEVKEGKLFFRTLMVNGHYAERARYPEQGRLTHETSFNGVWMSTVAGGWKDKPTEEELTRMKFKKEDIGANFETKNAELTIYHHWDETVVGVKSVDFDNQILTTSIKTGHPIGCFGSTEYVIWNTASGMTKPGKWYLDKIKGQLVYWPLPGENMKNIEIVVPTLENVIKIQNSSDISIKNLSIRSSNTPMVVGSFGAKLFDGAVSLTKSKNCKFQNLDITGATGWGLKLFGENITVENCHVHEVGAGGIYVVGSNAVVKNNYIHHVGRVYYSAIALYAGVTDPNVKEEWEFGKDKKNVLLSHNEIHDAPYVGIGIGGTDNVIEYNKVTKVMQELADGSGIYATFCKNLLLRGNYVGDLTVGKHGKVHSYYLDEWTNNSLVEKNISYEVNSPCFNHITKGNTVRNNIFISKEPMLIASPKSTGLTFENNVFISDKSVCLSNKNGIVSLAGNLFDVPNDEVYVSSSANYDYEKSKTKLELTNNNVIENSKLQFVGTTILPANDSPVWKMGMDWLKDLKIGATHFLFPL